MTVSVCGEFLDDCRCRYTQTDTPRSWTEMKARHIASVKRALRSDGRLPTRESAEPANASQRPTQPPVRVSLDELTATTLAHIATRQARRAA